MARASPALRGFVSLSSRRNSSIATAIIPAFLAPAIVPECTVSKRTQGLKYQSSIRHASVAASAHLTGNSLDGHKHSDRGLPSEVESLLSSTRRRRPAPWATAIESFLPPNLRLGGENVAENVSEEVNQYKPSRPIHTLPKILSMARSFCKTDLLGYIGVHQERWEAVIWLVKAMMEKYPGHREMERMSCQLPPLLWETANRNLDEVTEKAIQVELPQPSEISEQHNRHGRFSLDQYTLAHEPDHRGDPRNLGRKSLGQIWQSLGTMILQAADHPAEDPSYSLIMSHVFRILGHLHRINAFPDTIYNFTPPNDPTVLQRPPTLHVLSRRIMSTLSDVEWGLQWEETITKALSQGYELPKASVQPKLREFGPGLWLDLVLWACVEGGWVTEGAWIVIEMQRRMESKDTRWSTISWPEISEREAPELDWISILRLEIDKTRLNQVGGIGIATGTDLHVEMGTRTISREVVLALIDGLLNDPPSTAEGFGMNTVDLQRSIIACKSLLECNNLELDSNLMDAVILRILECFQDVKEQPGTLSRFLDLRSTEFKQVTRNASTPGSAGGHEMDDSAAVLGLQHRILHHSSVKGKQVLSLRTFKKIQSIVDTQREGKILAFAHELRERLERGDDASDLIGDNEDNVALIQPPLFPPRALLSFVDLLTNSRLFDLGNWLLLNEDIDGGLVHPALFSDQNLQPALLRFGTAASNSRLLSKVLVELETPLTEPIVHALLRFQVKLGKWTAVEELLEYLKYTPDTAWKPSDATTIAKAILQMEHEPPCNVDHNHVSRALSILQNLVNGKYDSKADPAQLPDFTQPMMANQLGRIFRTLPRSLRNITTRAPGEDLRAHASADITPNAFNIILETVADLYGSFAAKKLWDRWCRVPGIPKREQRFRSSGGYGERVVTPTLYMLRGVLRPVLETRRALHAAMIDELRTMRKSKTATSTTGQKDADIAAIHENHRLGHQDQVTLDWGIDMFKRFGMVERDINKEIPGSFPQLQRAKPVPDADDVDI